jgi:hypothetical protein
MAEKKGQMENMDKRINGKDSEKSSRERQSQKILSCLFSTHLSFSPFIPYPIPFIHNVFLPQLWKPLL